MEAFFYDCFLQEKQRCKYGPNVRFHYIDVRMRKEQQEGKRFIQTQYSDIYIPSSCTTIITSQVRTFGDKPNVTTIPSIINDLNSIFILYNAISDPSLLLRLCFSTDDIRTI